MSNSEQKSTEEVNFKMRRSFSWDKAFYTNGFLDDDELSSMIKGDGDDLNHELQKIEEINNQESKLFQELEASTKKSTNLSSKKKDSQPKKGRTSQTSSSSSSPIKTIHPTRSSPSSTPARRSACSKTDKTTTNSPSKTSPGITPKKKVTPVNTRISRTSPASPVSSVSSPSPSPSSSSPSSSKSSKFGVNQRSKRGSSVPCRSSMNSEKTSSMKTTKPAVKLIPKTQSSITLKFKPPPESSVSSSTHVVNQKSKLNGDKRSTVQHRSKSTNYKQPVASRTETRNPNASKPRKLLATKTVAAVNATVKPSKKQSNAKAKSLENMICISPEVLDIKGKLNALKMEIRMQKKERCKETKMGHDESGKGESSSIIRMNNNTKPI